MKKTFCNHCEKEITGGYRIYELGELWIDLHAECAKPLAKYVRDYLHWPAHQPHMTHVHVAIPGKKTE